MDLILNLLAVVLGSAVGVLVDPVVWALAVGLSFIPRAFVALWLALAYALVRVLLLPVALHGLEAVRDLWPLYVVVCWWTVWGLAAGARALRRALMDHMDPPGRLVDVSTKTKSARARGAGASLGQD